MRWMITFCALSLLTLVLANSTTFANADAPTHFQTDRTQTTEEISLSLAGDWLLAWDRFLTPAQARDAFRSGTLPVADVPKFWLSDRPPDAPKATSNLRATFIAHVTLPENVRHDRLLSLPIMRDAFRLYWVPLDGSEQPVFVTQQGEFGASPIVARRQITVPLPFTGEGLLVVHLEEKIRYWGGITGTPAITHVKAANTSLTWTALLNGAAIGALLLVSCRNLLLFRSFLKDRAAGCLLFLAAVVTVRAICTSEVVETLFGTQYFLARMRIELLTIPLISSTGLALHRTLLPRHFFLPFHKPLHATSAVLLLALLVLPESHFHYLLNISLLHALSAISLTLLHILTYWRRREEGIHQILLPLLLGLFAAVHDVLASNSDAYDIFLIPFAVIMIVSGYSQLVARRAAIAINRATELESETTELHRKHSDAVRKAQHDHLTGLLNRQAFDLHLATEWNCFLAENRPLAVVIFDIDHFKSINDNHGHPVGDRVLSALAARLTEIYLRKSDRLCRYGGEEFALILPDTTEEEAAALAEHFRNLVSAPPILHADPEISLTCSFGVAATDFVHAGVAQDLILAADQALYVAKSRGRNRVCRSTARLAA